MPKTPNKIYMNVLYDMYDIVGGGGGEGECF